MLLALFACGAANARDVCYRLVQKSGVSSVDKEFFPRILILKDEPSEAVFAESGDKKLAWVGLSVSYQKYFHKHSFWKKSGDHLIIVLSSGFDGLEINVVESAGKVFGTAKPFTDIPSERNLYDVEMSPISCPQAQQ
jgi:hypothetical protein